MPRAIPGHDQHYTENLGKMIIRLKVIRRRTVNFICQELGIPRQVVEQTLKLWRERREVMTQKELGEQKRRKIMTDIEIDSLCLLLERKPDYYLNELQDLLRIEHGINVGVSTIWDTLTELGLGRKGLYKTESECERYESKRSFFRFEIGAETPERLVFVDESRLDIRTIEHRLGRGSTIPPANFQRGKGYSVLPALCSDGLIHSDIKLGTYDGPSFVSYIETLLGRMNAWPEPRSVLVMDKRVIQHAPEVKQLCKEHGVILYYLPPYSPDYNPVEEAFSHVKSYLHFHGDELRASLYSNNHSAIYGQLYTALGTITTDKARRWMCHSGYLSGPVDR